MLTSIRFDCVARQIRELGSDTWDAIVIGAGPAGSMAARNAALAGLKTVLIDSKQFPRSKVCGGYLNSRALDVLTRAGLEVNQALGPHSPARELHLVCGRQRASFPLPLGQIICRQVFDSALLDSCCLAGATIQMETQATVEPTIDNDFRVVTVSRQGERTSLKAKVVICADGLARTSVRHLPEFASTAPADSRVGIGAVVVGRDNAIPPGQILMVVAARGYVGVSRISQNQFNIAAAVDPKLLTQSRPNDIVRTILSESRVELPLDLDCASWRGTPPLTNQPSNVAAERVFLIGDASGYVEPFTGEGIAAALEAGVAVVPFAARCVTKWSPSLAVSWTAFHRQAVYNRQQTCRQLAWILRRPWAAFAAINVCRLFPSVSRHVVAKTSTPNIIPNVHEITAI